MRFLDAEFVQGFIRMIVFSCLMSIINLLNANFTLRTCLQYSLFFTKKKVFF